MYIDHEAPVPKILKIQDTDHLVLCDVAVASPPTISPNTSYILTYMQFSKMAMFFFFHVKITGVLGRVSSIETNFKYSTEKLLP